MSSSRFIVLGLSGLRAVIGCVVLHNQPQTRKERVDFGASLVYHGLRIAYKYRGEDGLNNLSNMEVLIGQDNIHVQVKNADIYGRKKSTHTGQEKYPSMLKAVGGRKPQRGEGDPRALDMGKI